MTTRERRRGGKCCHELEQLNANYRSAIEGISKEFQNATDAFQTLIDNSFSTLNQSLGRSAIASKKQPRDIWFDYTHQAWVVDGKYQRCGHRDFMDCGCYGRIHAGESADPKYRETD